MWYPGVITVVPTAEPITIAQVKLQCSIATGDTSRDGIINLLIPAARQAVQTHCGIRLVEQTVKILCDGFRDFERVPEAPVKSISAITYIDTDGASQTLPGTVYEARIEGLAPSIALKYNQRWPAIQPGSRIEVSAVCGFAAIPADIVSALLLSVSKLMAFSRSDMLKRREVVEGVGETQWGGAVEISGALDDTICGLLEPYRNWPLA